MITKTGAHNQNIKNEKIQKNECAELPRVLTLLALELAVIKSSDPKSHQETREQYFYKIHYS